MANKNGPRSRETLFIENMTLGLAPIPAAIKAGYSENYAQSAIKAKLNNPLFISRLAKYADKLPETRTTLAKLRLSKLYDLEDKFYDLCQDDPELYAKHNKVAERDYKLAGLLKEEVSVQILIPVQVAIQVQSAMLEQHNPADVVTIENPEPVAIDDETDLS